MEPVLRMSLALCVMVTVCQQRIVTLKAMGILKALNQRSRQMTSLAAVRFILNTLSRFQHAFLCIDCEVTVQDTSRERGRIPGEYFDLLHSLLFYTCTYRRWQTQCV